MLRVVYYRGCRPSSILASRPPPLPSVVGDNNDDNKTNPPSKNILRIERVNSIGILVSASELRWIVLWKAPWKYERRRLSVERNGTKSMEIFLVMSSWGGGFVKMKTEGGRNCFYLGSTCVSIEFRKGCEMGTTPQVSNDTIMGIGLCGLCL